MRSPYAITIYTIRDLERFLEFLNESRLPNPPTHQVCFQSETWPVTVAIADALSLEHLNPVSEVSVTETPLRRPPANLLSVGTTKT